MTLSGATKVITTYRCKLSSIHRKMLCLVGVLLMPMLVSAYVVGDTGVTQESITAVCKTKGDIVFIVDRSGSIGQANWDFQIEALTILVDDFIVGPDDMQFGAVTFNSDSEEEFVLDQHMTNAAVKTALDNIIYTTGYTNIASGFREARYVFEKPGNRAGVKDIAVLFTDGQANREESNTDVELLNLKNAGVTVLTVGIGQSHNAEALKAYASDESWYFTVDNYGDLDEVIHDISGSVCEAIDRPSTLCQNCGDFNEDHYGYMPHEDCYSYYLCKWDPATETVDLFAAMECAPGTVFSAVDARDGRPCVHIDEDNPDCPREIEIPPVDNTEASCPYVANPEDDGDFGMMGDGIFTKVGSCRGGYWDLNTCTCLGAITDCTCRLMLDFVDNVQDHSCHGSWISNDEPKVTLESAKFDKGGRFTGLLNSANKAPSLMSWALNGAFSDCTQGGQQQLTVALWLKYTGGNGNTHGLVTYCGDSDQTPGFYLNLNPSRTVSGGIETYENGMVTVESTTQLHMNEWYYVSMVYNSKNIKLYVTGDAHYSNCAMGSTGSACTPEDTEDQTGCVASRNCGLKIGASGASSWQSNSFFTGLMDDVQILYGANYKACRG